MKDRVEAVLNVGLRVPSIMLLDVLYRWDVSSFFQKIQRSSLSNNPLFQYKYLALYLHYVGEYWCLSHTHTACSGANTFLSVLVLHRGLGLVFYTLDKVTHV